MNSTLRVIPAIFLLLSTVFMVTSCGPKDPMAKLEKEIEKKETEISEAEAALKELKNEYSKLDTTVKEDVKVLVATKKIQPQSFSHYFTVNGVVEAEGDVNLTPEMSGQITSMSVSEGDEVKKGDVIFEINSQMIRNNIAELEAQLSLSKVVFKKQKKLWDQGIGSEIQYLEAKTNVEAMDKRLGALQSQLAMAIVKSPIDGTVETIYAEKGELASPGMPVVQVVNVGKLKVTADVSESYMSTVGEGDSVEVSFPSVNGGINYTLPVLRVGKTINTGNRTFPIEVRMKNTSGLIKPNALAKVEIRDYAADSAMVIPTAAVQQDTKGHFLFKVVSNDGHKTAKKTYVSIGKVSEGDTELKPGGLDFGDEVIIKGFNRVADGVKVNL